MMKMILTFIALVTVNSALFAYTAAVSDSSFTIDKTIPSYLEVADRGIALLPSWNNSCNDNNNVLRELLKLNNETTTTLVDTLSDAAGGLIRKTEDGNIPEAGSATDDCAAPRLFSKPWTLDVTNALTGRKAFSKEMDEPTFLLHTDGWAPGVYVVRALVGDESLAGKITVK